MATWEILADPCVFQILSSNVVWTSRVFVSSKSHKSCRVTSQIFLKMKMEIEEIEEMEVEEQGQVEVEEVEVTIVEVVVKTEVKKSKV